MPIDHRATQRRPSGYSPATVRNFTNTRSTLEQLARGYAPHVAGGFTLGGKLSGVTWSEDKMSFRTRCGDIYTAIQCPEPVYPQPTPENGRFIIEVTDGSTGEFMGFV